MKIREMLASIFRATLLLGAMSIPAFVAADNMNCGWTAVHNTTAVRLLHAIGATTHRLTKNAAAAIPAEASSTILVDALIFCGGDLILKVFNWVPRRLLLLPKQAALVLLLLQYQVQMWVGRQQQVLL